MIELLVAIAIIAVLAAKLPRLAQEPALRDYLDSQGEFDDHEILNAIRLVMSTPNYQLT